MRQVMAALVSMALASFIAPAHADEAWAEHPAAGRPAWFTQVLQRQVYEAGPRGIAIPASAAIPTSSLAFLGIRPGQLLLV